jgi:hypothetical protein
MDTVANRDAGVQVVAPGLVGLVVGGCVSEVPNDCLGVELAGPNDDGQVLAIGGDAYAKQLSQQLLGKAGGAFLIAHADARFGRLLGEGRS